ncbi:MAG TPA: GNAT family N-acetyltransferase [Puia sp.]
MVFRRAETNDIPQIQKVRHEVNENILSDPGMVTDADCTEYIEKRGRGWVCEVQNEIVGFAIADLMEHNIWALFVLPDFEHQGIGKKLHAMMLEWYFSMTKEKVWLGTAPNTRAELFYRNAGWKENGLHGKGEIKFEMEFATWKSLH